MSFFKELFSESTQVSCMRFMAVSSLLVGAGLAFICVLDNRDLSTATPLIALFVGSAFGGKTWQKYAEKKGTPVKNGK